MNQQASDLPRSVQIIGRYRTLIGLVALLGALVGVVFAVATPFKQVAGDSLLGAVLGALLGIIAALAGGQTIIDSPALPRALDVGAGDRGSGQPTRYATNGLTLHQLAREYAQRTAAPDG